MAAGEGGKNTAPVGGIGSSGERHPPGVPRDSQRAPDAGPRRGGDWGRRPVADRGGIGCGVWGSEPGRSVATTWKGWRP